MPAKRKKRTMSDATSAEAQITEPLEATHGPRLSPQEYAATPAEALPQIGSVLRDLRDKKGLTQQEVSNAMGHRSPEWIGLIESNLRTIDINILPQLAVLLDCNPRDLLKIAMFQYFPAVADALFPENVRPFPRKLKNQGLSMTLDTKEHLWLFQNLPADSQQVVRVVTKALAETTRALVRVNRKKLTAVTAKRA